MVTLKANRLFNNVILPKKAHTGIFEDAAYDLFFFIPEYETDRDSPGQPIIELLPGKTVIIPTNLRLIIPDGYWLKFHERSGLGSKGIKIQGGVIDSGYTGSLGIITNNNTNKPITLWADKPLAQFTVEKVIQSDIQVISDDDLEYEASLRDRGNNGYGSSDKK